MAERPPDAELERSTNKAMAWGFVVMVLMVLIFPVYRFYEPSSRESDREAQLDFLADQGADLYGFNCASCHGIVGQGGIGMRQGQHGKAFEAVRVFGTNGGDFVVGDFG